MGTNWSRRDMLMLMASVGGLGAVEKATAALGLIPQGTGASQVALKPASEGNNTVVVLGAGIAGLCAAYELERAGYKVTVLEASHRIGGRNLTIRGGDFIDELGRPNYCQFDKSPNLYFNAGPARIPGHHRLTLHYCKTLSVPLHVRANSSRMAYVYDEQALGKKPVRIAEYIADTRGYLAELAQKSGADLQLDNTLTTDDKAVLDSFIGHFGDLDKGHYRGSSRAGSLIHRMMQGERPHLPHDFANLINSETALQGILGTEYYDWAAPLMEAVGGMDKIVDGFVSHIRSPIHVFAQVQQITTRDNGVVVRYQHDNQIKTLEADYCFNGIPSHFMAGIPNNLPSDYQEALASLERGRLFKIALQMNKRFWEDEGIYGGISYTNDPVAQLWYPSHDPHAEKGVMLGAYSWDAKQVDRFAFLSLEQRIEEAAASGAKIHPNYARYIDSGVSVPWTRMNHMMGCGAHMPVEKRAQYLPLLQAPAGRHFMIGDQVTLHPGWQEGAFASVVNALQHFNERQKAA